MALLDYGYTITIEKDGTCSPDAPHTNQWQKRPKGGVYADISGQTGATYTVADEDRAADIRLVQDFGGVKAYSNALTVTSVLPGCPYPDPTTFPHIEPTFAKNGDTITMTEKLHIDGIAESDYIPTWYGIPAMSNQSVREVIQNGGYTLKVKKGWSKKYEGIIVNQTFKDADDLDPLCVGFYNDSNPVYVEYVEAKTFGVNKMFFSSPITTHRTNNQYEFTYDGDVIHYKAEPKWDPNYADFVSETKTAGSYKFVLFHHTEGTGLIECTLTSEEQSTEDEDPVYRNLYVTTEPPEFTLGEVDIIGPEIVKTSTNNTYTLTWSGNAPRNDVSWGWTAKDTIVNNKATLSPFVYWSDPGDYWIQASVTYRHESLLIRLNVTAID